MISRNLYYFYNTPLPARFGLVSMQVNVDGNKRFLIIAGRTISIQVMLYNLRFLFTSSTIIVIVSQ